MSYIFPSNLRYAFFIIGLFISIQSFSQFQDDFNDSSFPNDPDWFGDTNIYQVNAASELQLMDVDGGTSSIYTPLATGDTVTWELFFRLEFAPSTSNQLKVYLAANSSSFEESLNGYFLQIGASGSEDALELRRQDGTSSTLLLSGQTGGVAVDPSVRVRVTRSPGGLWQLSADYSGGANFQDEGSVNDNTYTSGNFFGFHCEYSSTRKDKFFFDDIFAGPLVQDQTAPVLLSANALDATTVVLNFDEALDITTATSAANYTLDNGVQVTNASLDTDPSKVVLAVSGLESGTTYNLTTEGIADINDNISEVQNASFTFFLLENAAPFDILINEVFANPDPTETGLPDAEFLELYNRSDKAIELLNFELSDASSSKSLPSYILPPQSYLIICDTEDEDLFSGFGAVLSLSGLFALNDSGDEVRLQNAESELVHEMSYTTSTYQSEEKSGGGYSLELINPTLYCRGEENYRASDASLGGTPGIENTIFDDSPDITAPQVQSVIALSESEVRIVFNEAMAEAVVVANGFSIDGKSILDVELSDDRRTVDLLIDAPFFVDQQSYNLNVGAPVADCSGNTINTAILNFTYFEAQPADRYDILINEFYPDFSPSLGLPEKEFVELYNRSDKTISLEGFEIRNGNDFAVLPFYLLLPDAYVTVYQTGGRGFDVYGDTIALDDFIVLANEVDEFGLYDPSVLLIHNVLYSIGWYQDLAKSDGGYSLELINPDVPCQFGENWRASEALIGGTPGQANSILNLQLDDVPLKLQRVFPPSDNELRLIFNKAVDIDVAEDISLYNIDGLDVLVATVNELLPNNVLLEFAESINPGQIYEVNVGDALLDCIGTPLESNNSAQFALPETIEVGEIIINEILYDPETGGARFIEFFNRSNKIFNLGDLKIAKRGEDGQSIERISEVSIDYLFFPGEYVVLTTSPEDIQQRYIVEAPEKMFFSSLPAYDSKADIVVVFVPDILGPRIIEELKYDEGFHNALLDDTEGVSLERITFSGPTSDPNNWQSAAATIGYATPTYRNSQFQEPTTTEDNTFELPNRTFSPDGDGFEDVLIIQYATPQGGWVANIRIYDANGRLVKQIINNESLANEGNFIWEGETDANDKARIGIYVVWIEIFKENGEVEYKKLTCVLAGQLD
jgi:hypothetical protein